MLGGGLFEALNVLPKGYRYSNRICLQVYPETFVKKIIAREVVFQKSCEYHTVSTITRGAEAP